jgi:hypothetical protein
MSVFRYNAWRMLKIDGAHRPGKSRFDVYICLFQNINNWVSI